MDSERGRDYKSVRGRVREGNRRKEREDTEERHIGERKRGRLEEEEEIHTEKDRVKERNK